MISLTYLLAPWPNHEKHLSDHKSIFWTFGNDLGNEGRYAWS